MIPALFLAAVPALAAPPVSQDSPEGVRVEETSKGKQVVVDPGVLLGDLVRAGGNLLGRVYSFHQDASGTLASTPLGMTAPRSIPIAEFEPWLEGVLLSHGFATLLPPEGSLEPLRLVNLRSADRTQVETAAPFVPVEEISGFRHPGTLIRTTLPLRYLDAGRAVTNLRPLMTDPNLEKVSTLGNANSVVIQAFPRTVSTFLAILKGVDVEPPEAARPAAAAERAAGGDAATPRRETATLEAWLRSLEDAADALRDAIRDLAAELRR